MTPAQATRLHTLASRKSKAPVKEEKKVNTQQNNQEENDSEESSESEVCAICQMEFAPDAQLLACKKCDNGFHVKCLNK